MRETADAVVIGAGPNGLASAIVLADAGWDVLVLEAGAEPGGAVRTAEVTAPGFRNDLFSAFYPLAAASPVLSRLDLEAHGLRWLRSPAVVANPLPGGQAAVVHGDRAATAAELDADAPGDGDAWLAFIDQWESIADPLLATLLGPFPPVRAGARLALRLGPRGLRAFGHTALVPARRMATERFRGSHGRALIAGATAHADIPPEGAGSGLLAWLLLGLGQTVGFPAPEGGAGQLTAALVNRLAAAGGQVRCGAAVETIEVRRGRAVAVRLAGGERVEARKAIVADVDAGALYERMLPPDAVPEGVHAALARRELGPGTIKVDWALSAPIPWTAPVLATSGCVHFADSIDELTEACAAIAVGRAPERPPMLLGQMTTVDPSRSPAGTESVWAYIHVPNGWRGSVDDAVRGMEARIEERAPGFGDLVLARHVAGPADLEHADANLVGGDLSGGVLGLHNQLLWRPTPGLARTETPVAGLFLGSASAHPGPGVHGMVGANAARAALLGGGRLRRKVTAPLRAALR